MKNEDEIKGVLFALETLFESAGEISWSRGIRALRNEFEIDPKTAMSKIHALFGGMGSFNDLILHHEGHPLFKENEALSRYRRQLYILIHE